MEKLVDEIELQVSRHEGVIEALELQLSNLGPKDDVLALTQRHAELQEALAGSLSAWEEHSLRLDELKAMRG